MSANSVVIPASTSQPAKPGQNIALTGLTSDEAHTRLEKDGPNAMPDTSAHPLRNAVAKFWAPVPWLLEASIVLELALNKYYEAAVIAALPIFNAALAYFQESRAQATLTALKSRLALNASVQRDGAWKAVPAAELVCGDLVKLLLGGVVAADEHLTGGSVELDQSMLIGESLPIEAGPGVDTYAGALVRRGEATAVVTATALAAGLASCLNGGSSGVSATVNGGTVSVVLYISLAPSFYYVLEGGIGNSIPGSFSFSTSGTLTSSAVVADAGTVQVTISNGSNSVTTAPVYWGQTSTSTTLATAIASAINAVAGGEVKATPDAVDPSNVDLLSTGTGTAADYSISFAVNDTQTTAYPALFPNASFTVNEGSMTGGANQDGTSVLYDNGTLSALVNGCAASTGYGGGSTFASLASSLASSINSYCPTLISATASGAVVTVTAKAQGAAGDYSLTSDGGQNNGQNSALFPNPSFTMTDSGSAMTSSTIYDGGGLVALIFVTPGQAPCSPAAVWEKGSTPALLATSLAASISSSCGGQVSASASGAVVTITATTAGAASDYSLVSTGGHSSSFASPSFTMTPSGSALSGGSSPTYAAATLTFAGTLLVSGGAFGVEIGTPTGGNSCMASVQFATGSTLASLAATLASNINKECSALVSANASGAQVTVTATQPGAAGKDSIYTFLEGCSCSQSNPIPGLTLTASGSALSVGSSTTYATATLTIAGTEQSTVLNATGSFTVSGSEQSSGALGSNGTLYSYFVPQGGYAPNGNLLLHSDSIMGDWNFSYDAVDRLVSAMQVAATLTSTEYQGKYGCWAYDSFGNRTLEAFSTATCSNNPTPQAFTTYLANNRISSSTASPATVAAGSYVYDPSGNTLYDGNNRYWYDAEGQLCAVQSQRVAGAPIIQYVYDAEGARIAKGTLASAPGSSTATCAPPPLGSSSFLSNRYLVDQGGDQVTELNGSGVWQHSNVWAGGKLVATYDTKGIHFELSDPLGTKRVQANALGQVEENCTSLPFGNDVGNNPSVTCTGPGVDATEHHFTQKERDTETGNDYFMARYYSSALGRFTTPDWSAKETPVPYATFADPQSLNLYAYVRNNPLSGTDPDGHCGGPNDPCSKVTVTATPPSQPAPVHETTVTDKDGVKHTGTGPTATLDMTVSVNGTPTDGVHVTETNQATMTTPDQTTTGRPVVGGATDSKNGGKYSDVVGPTIPSSKMSSGAAAKAYNNTPATLVDRQTQTLKFDAVGGQPGFTCEATSIRTVTDTADGRTISPGGYTLTTTQPVVTSPQQPH